MYLALFLVLAMILNKALINHLNTRNKLYTLLDLERNTIEMTAAILKRAKKVGEKREKQEKKIELLMKVDYDNGWF